MSAIATPQLKEALSQLQIRNFSRNVAPQLHIRAITMFQKSALSSLQLLKETPLSYCISACPQSHFFQLFATF
jgi:hypothetical protein